MSDFLRNRRNELQGSPVQDSFNILVYGDYGTGKSSLLSTCRLPIYIQSFDPGGTKLKVLEDLASKGLAILDTVCEDEDAKAPKAFELFDKNFNEMKKANAFASLGTYAIDSLTTLSDAVMFYILKREGRAGTNPQLQDYGVHQLMLQQIIRKCCSLPCDFLLTGHIDTAKDEVTGRLITSLLVPGKTSVKVPILFDEVLLTNVDVDNKKNTTYTVRLTGDAKYKTSTRRFSGEGFQMYETPDIMRLRALAGKPCEHLKPIGD